MSVTFVSSAIVNTSKSFQYFGQGYRYSLKNTSAKGTHALLQVKKSLLALFIKRVGWINTVGLAHLEVWEQSPGWYMVTVLDEDYSSVVKKFLARFNRWVLTQLNKAKDTVSQTQAIVQANNCLHKSYLIMTGYTPIKTPQIKPAPFQSLEALAARFSRPSFKGEQYAH